MREEIYAKRFDGFWKQHRVHQTWFFDAQTSYDIIFTPPMEAAPVPGYSKGGKEVVGKEKNIRITVGVNNIFGQRPPTSFGFEIGNAVKYPGFFLR